MKRKKQSAILEKARKNSLFPYWTRSVEEHWAEDSRVIHPEALLQVPDGLHVILRKLQVFQGEIFFYPRNIFGLRDY